ncbi:MAG: hypothetical protein UZ19_OD1000133 [Parcubacteria bacterium OLB19]|nr:MAG: hypothetical protein UZ19_OD1000133 [Parcubacteria bacterium OLB19]
MNKTLEHSLYHSALRISVLVFTSALIFDSGLVLEETKLFSTSTQQYLANVVGVKASVEPTEMNQLTAKITELEGELEEKERLIAVSIKDNSVGGIDKSTLILSIIVGVLLVLIILNYILDFIRMRKVVLMQKDTV